MQSKKYFFSKRNDSVVLTSVKMATDKTLNVHAIDNIITMAQTMSTLGISADGLTTLEQMKARVIEELHSSQTKGNWTAGKAFSVFSETKEDDARKRNLLLELYQITQECLNKMDDRLIRLLNSNFAVNVKEAVMSQQERLNIKEYVLLVAGETSAGKSSLINLILGEELLPSALLSTTSTICELRYGKKKRVLAHYKKENSETDPKIEEIILSEPNKGKSYIGQLSPYLHVKGDRERGSQFKKIQLFWPHELLQKGIVIVDSPGIGESNIMDEIVTDYLPEAFCFMYVINSSNAGGIQKDRIEKLLEDARRIAIEKEQCFLCESALFVCNKWDLVPQPEIGSVKEHVIRKLERCWPDLNPSTQIVYLSTADAGKAQDLGAISPDFEILINAFRSMVLKTIDARIQTYWKWLDYLLSRMSYHTKAFIHNAAKDGEDVRTKLSAVAERIKQMENEQHLIMDNLQEQLDNKIDEVVRVLSVHLASDDTQRNLTSWTDDDAPKKQETWAATENDITKAIKNRLHDELKQWELDNHVFSDSKKALIQRFSNRVNVLQNQIHNVEECIASDEILDEQSISSHIEFTIGEKILIGVTSPVWIPVGLVALVLVGIPVLGAKAVKEALVEKSNMKLYVKDRSGYLSRKSKEYVVNFSKEESLRPYVNDQLKEVQKLLDRMKSKIPAIIAANHLLIIQLLLDAGAKKQVMKFYLPINSTISNIRGKLSIFAIQEARPADIDSSELEWKEDESSCRGKGGFAHVYEARMKKSGKEVALKVFNDVVNTENAYHLLTEEKILRKLKHPNIVKFYGTSLMRKDDNFRMIFVMELCVDNLKRFLTDHPEKAPGKSRGSVPSAAKTIVQWALQISLALDFIHTRGIVHRDLKTENILISKDDSVKIADVGVSKKVNEITGTLVGTPIYMAPEVFASSMYDWKADIYGFGLILWELWHGGTAFSELLHDPVSSENFGMMIRNGYRPMPPEGNMHPPPSWEDVMTKCWKTKPDERPTARNCKDDLTELAKCINA